MKAAMDHVVLNVENIDEMMRFYSDVLELDTERLAEFERGDVLFPSLRLNADTLIDLMPAAMWGGVGDERGGPRVNMDHFCLSLSRDDWDALLVRVEAAGVAIEAGPMTLWGAHGDATAIYVRDPEGNRLEFRTYGD